jgi:hypothetical protein
MFMGGSAAALSAFALKVRNFGGLVHAATVWTSPPEIDNTGNQNVSAALTNWLATTGQPGDTFKLRRGPGFAPGVFWIPQGIRIGKPMVFDLVGCWLVTGTTLGFDDTNIEQNKVAMPPLWNDWDEQTYGGWPSRRVNVLIASSDVSVISSAVNGRIQGAARTVHYRGGETLVGRKVPTGCLFHGQAFGDGQHGIRIGGRPGAYSSTNKYQNILIDLTNTGVEFVHGDGVYLNDNHSFITIKGRQLGPDLLGGVPSPIDDGNLKANSLAGGTIVMANGQPYDPDAPSNVSNPRSGDRWQPDLLPLPGIHHVGRQGIATDFRNYDTTVEDLALWRTGRSIIDLEPAAAFAEIKRFTVRHIEAGVHTLLFMPCAGGAGPIDFLLVDDVISYELPTINSSAPGAQADGRCHNWLLRNIRCPTGVKARVGSIFTLPRIDTLWILDNHALVKGTGEGIKTDVGDVGVNGASTGVLISPEEAVQFPFAP